MDLLIVAIGAAIASTALGFLWYLPQTFGTIWMKECGLNEKELANRPMTKPLTASIASNILIAVILWYARNSIFAGVGLRDFLITIAFTWFAFVLCIRMVHVFFEGKTIRYVAVTSAHDLVSLMLLGLLAYYV